MFRQISRAAVLCLAVQAALGAPLGAQEGPCSTAKTVEECFEEGYRSVSGTSVRVMAEKADSQVRTAVTSSVSDASTQGASLSNFLSPFLALVDSGELGDEGERIAIEVAAKVLDDLDKDTKLQVVFNEPEIFSPLRMRLADSMMTATLDRLERSVGDGDDLTVNLSWSPVNDRFGRSMEHHRPTLRQLFEPVVEGAFQSASLADKRLPTALLISLQQQCPDPQDSSALSFACLSAEQRGQVFQAGKALGEQNETIKRAVSDASLFQLGKLLNNQPQIIATASYRARDDIAGPDETFIKVTYEQGIVNLNSLRKACSGRADLLACYSAYVGNEQRGASIAAGNRIAFSLEYSDTADYSISFDPIAMDGSAFTFKQPGARSLMASLTYGRYLWVRGADSARVDLSLMFDQVDNESGSTSGPIAATMRQDRFLGSLTYTQKLNDKTGAVLGLTWANKPEFLGDVEEKLGARAGLTYKILGGGGS